ncbi:MAG: hypothetical protein WD229_16750 [Pirellulales bacterium]
MPRDLTAAVLGATPEYRDMLFELGFTNVLLLDNNASFVNRMTPLRVHANSERLLLGDWLESLETLRGSLGVVLSDLTSGNLTYEQRPEFYGRIESALVAGGVFCDKILTHPTAHLSSSELATAYEDQPLNLQTANRFSCEMLFCSDLLDEKECVDTERFYDRIEAEFASPRLKAISRLAQYVTPRGMRWFYGRSWRDLQLSYCTGLKLGRQADDETTSPYIGRLNLFVFEKGLR